MRAQCYIYDIVYVKNLCAKDIWHSYVKDGIIYLRNEVGEVVMIGVAEKPEESQEKIKEQMCDNYCRYPYLLNCNIEDICKECPMNKL